MLFRKNVAKFCSYCQYAGKTDGKHMLCSKKGFVDPDSHCHCFRYDPLKRTPPRYSPKDFSQFQDSDFSL